MFSACVDNATWAGGAGSWWMAAAGLLRHGDTARRREGGSMFSPSSRPSCELTKGVIWRDRHILRTLVHYMHTVSEMLVLYYELVLLIFLVVCIILCILRARIVFMHSIGRMHTTLVVVLLLLVVSMHICLI